MQISYQGRMIDCDEVEVLASKEEWNVYQLANGKELSTKTVIIRVCRAKTEKAPDGEPLYLTQTQQIIKVK